MVGVKVEVQVADAVVPANVHVVNVPVTPVSVRLTVPVGVVAPVADVSVTVTVQVELWPTTTGLVQLTAVVVLCCGVAVTAMMNVPVLGE